jgi:hypothetical protein
MNNMVRTYRAQLFAVAAAAVGFGFASAASASLVTFDGTPSTSWTDGTFSTDLSGVFTDGFYEITSTSAYNGYGQTGETIYFNSPVTLDSLSLGKCGFCDDNSPTSFEVVLLNSSDTTLASESITPSFTPQLLTFNTPGVSSVVFYTFSPNADPYGTGRSNVAWYTVSDVTYNASLVPEPSTWAMMLLGFADLGFVGYRRQRQRLAGAASV